LFTLGKKFENHIIFAQLIPKIPKESKTSSKPKIIQKNIGLHVD
jgi:hypothetical protein